MVNGLQRQQISTDREIKVQRAWVEGELEETAMAAQVQQVQQVKQIRSELVSELAAEQDRRISATAVQVEKRVGTLELTTGRGFIESFRAVAVLNEDIARLYEESFGALVEERLAPDGQGWYTEQEFNRFFIDDGQTWSECSTSKRGRPVR